MSDFTFTFDFHALEKEMATQSSVLAWRIPGTGEPGGLPSLGSQSWTRLKRLSSSSPCDYGGWQVQSWWQSPQDGDPGKSWLQTSRLKAIWGRVLFFQGTIAISLRSSTDWMTSNLIMEINLLYAKSIELNVILNWKTISLDI